MKPLPYGYRTVGSLSVGFACLLVYYPGLQVIAQMLTSLEKHGILFKNKLECAEAMLFITTPLVLFFGSSLLLNEAPTRLRLASRLLIVAGILLLLCATVVTWQMMDEMRRDHTAGLMVCMVPMFIMPASIWGVTVLTAGIKLLSRLRQSD